MRVTPELLRLVASSEKIFDDVPGTPKEPTPPPVVEPSSLPYLLSVEQAAALLATSSEAVYARVSRGQLDGRHGLVRAGRKVQFLRDRLLRSLERMAYEQTPRGRK